MAGRDNFRMVNFRLNLEKKEEKELFEYLQKIEHGMEKECYGNKSRFIKRVLMDFLSSQRQTEQQKISKEEKQKNDQKLEQMMEEKLSGNRQLLLQELSVMVRMAVTEVMTKAEENGYFVQKSDRSSDDYDKGSGGEQKEGLAELPKESETMPEEAMSYFRNL